MFRNTADSKADFERFVRRVAESDTVWYLDSDNGVAVSPSNADLDSDEDPPAVLLFFSDEAYAKRAGAASFPDHAVASMKLFEFMYRWLPGMSQDQVFAGPNWTADLIGLEVDPFELREVIAAAMSQEHLDRHEQLFQQLSGQA